MKMKDKTWDFETDIVTQEHKFYFFILNSGQCHEVWLDGCYCSTAFWFSSGSSSSVTVSVGAVLIVCAS